MENHGHRLPAFRTPRGPAGAGAAWLLPALIATPPHPHAPMATAAALAPGRGRRRMPVTRHPSSPAVFRERPGATTATDRPILGRPGALLLVLADRQPADGIGLRLLRQPAAARGPTAAASAPGAGTAFSSAAWCPESVPPLLTPSPPGRVRELLMPSRSRPVGTGLVAASFWRRSTVSWVRCRRHLVRSCRLAMPPRQVAIRAALDPSRQSSALAVALDPAASRYSVRRVPQPRPAPRHTADRSALVPGPRPAAALLRPVSRCALRHGVMCLGMVGRGSHPIRRPRRARGARESLLRMDGVLEPKELHLLRPSRSPGKHPSPRVAVLQPVSRAVSAFASRRNADSAGHTGHRNPTECIYPVEGAHCVPAPGARRAGATLRGSREWSGRPQWPC